MFTDRYGNLTDDSDRWTHHEPAFDFEGPDGDDWGHGYPKCGGDDRGCPGCRHCDPVDYENQPTGWGIDPTESADVYRLNRELAANWSVVCGGRDPGPQRFRLACLWAGPDPRTVRASGRVWEKLFCECETMTEAVRRYGEWADKVTKRKPKS